MNDTPLFIPLKSEFYHAFVEGKKDTEYRWYGPRWNERTCYVGRPVVLSKGYGKRYRRRGEVVGFQRSSPPDMESWFACFGTITGEAACIKIKLHDGDSHGS